MISIFTQLNIPPNLSRHASIYCLITFVCVRWFCPWAGPTLPTESEFVWSALASLGQGFQACTVCCQRNPHLFLNWILYINRPSLKKIWLVWWNMQYYYIYKSYIEHKTTTRGLLPWTMNSAWEVSYGEHGILMRMRT